MASLAFVKSAVARSDWNASTPRRTALTAFNVSEWSKKSPSNRFNDGR